MALIPFEMNDFESELRDIITTQFEDKDVFGRYLKLIRTECQELLEVYQDLMQLRDIDSATGHQLEIIGRIVGQDRIVINGDLFPFFGFEGVLNSESFGTIYSKVIGGNWWALGTKIGGDVSLSDDQYRLLIKAKIVKNNARGLNEDYIKFGNFVLDAEIDFEDDSGAFSAATVLVGRRMTMFERALMSYVFEGVDYAMTYSPKPLGVGIDVGVFDANGTLGFVGTPGAKGMISISFPIDGGIFADAYFLE